MKIIIALNTSWNLHNFRAGLIRALVRSGHDIVAVAPPDDYSARLDKLGCRFEPLPMDNHGLDPRKDMLLLWRYLRLFRRERPDVVLGYTIKPNIYGSIAAHLLCIPVINNVTGLGRSFARNDWLNLLVRILYKVAFSRSSVVFFQNEHDIREFVDKKLVRPEVCRRLPGSGIDLSHFSLGHSDVCHLCGNETFRFLLFSRLLWEKGVGIFVEAARIVVKRFPHTQFRLIGFIDNKKADAVSESEIKRWEAEGIIVYAGCFDDVRHEIASADCVVLPSYYPEGVPRSLLEAAALGRPIITTDSPGCRDVVDDGINGFLCRIRDADDLAAKMLLMMTISQERRDTMGIASRQKVELEFDEQIVVQNYFDAIMHVAQVHGTIYLP